MRNIFLYRMGGETLCRALHVVGGTHVRTHTAYCTVESTMSRKSDGVQVSYHSSLGVIHPDGLQCCSCFVFQLCGSTSKPANSKLPNFEYFFGHAVLNERVGWVDQRYGVVHIRICLGHETVFLLNPYPYLPKVCTCARTCNRVYCIYSGIP